MRGAVDARRVLQLGRNGHEKLPQQERAEHADHKGEDEPFVAVVPVQQANQDVVGDQGDLRGDNQRPQVQGEQQGAPAKAQARERVGRQGGGEELAARDCHRHDHAIEEEPADWQALPDLRVVGPLRRVRPELGRQGSDLGDRLQRRRDHVGERQDHGHCGRRQQHIDQRIDDAAAD